MPFICTFSYRLNLDSHYECSHSYHTVKENTSTFCLFLNASFRYRVYADVTERLFEGRYSLKDSLTQKSKQNKVRSDDARTFSVNTLRTSLAVI